MTIAACHVSPEGVVLGTDSTTTIHRPGEAESAYYLDYEQKIFEIGPPGGTLALATWGQGRIGNTSHRTIAAKVGRSLAEQAAGSMEETATRLANALWTRMEAEYGEDLERALDLRRRLGDGGRELSPEEWDHLLLADSVINGGYFLAGRTSADEECSAYEVEWSIRSDEPQIRRLEREFPIFRGVPNMMERLIFGYDHELPERILASEKWSGNREELEEILNQNALIMPTLLPIREAIDWIHTVIHTTIRAVKFSGYHVCGGPVEIAVVTTDRPFRWVCHKPLDAAIITAQEGRGKP